MPHTGANPRAKLSAAWQAGDHLPDDSDHVTTPLHAQVITGSLLPDAGEVLRAKEKMRIAHLSQEFDVQPSRTLREEFVSAFGEQIQVRGRVGGWYGVPSAALAVLHYAALRWGEEQRAMHKEFVSAFGEQLQGARVPPALRCAALRWVVGVECLSAFGEQVWVGQGEVAPAWLSSGGGALAAGWGGSHIGQAAGDAQICSGNLPCPHRHKALPASGRMRAALLLAQFETCQPRAAAQGADSCRRRRCGRCCCRSSSGKKRSRRAWRSAGRTWTGCRSCWVRGVLFCFGLFCCIIFWWWVVGVVCMH